MGDLFVTATSTEMKKKKTEHIFLVNELQVRKSIVASIVTKVYLKNLDFAKLECNSTLGYYHSAALIQ